MKILIVEDTATNRTLLTWILEDNGHEVIEAADGKEGVEQFKAYQPDLVLMDVLMPVMDGVEATKQIRSHLGNTHVPIIFLTALSDDASLTKCLEVGGDDFISKPINEQVLKAKINAHSRIKELNEQLSKQNIELTRLHQLTQQEHIIAKKVFETAFSASLLDSSNIRHYISPAANFNGDLLLTAISPSGSLYGLVADFTGHGLPAAIGALPLSKAFFDAASRGDSVSSIAKELNHDLGEFLPDNMFAAAAIAEMNANGSRLTIWMGGMPDALLTNPDGKLKQTIQSRHMPLGILENDEFERDCYVINVDPGDRLYFYTDGIPEALNSDGIMYGEKRLLEHFNGRAADPFDSLIQDNISFTGAQSQADDITILELICKPVETCPYPRPQDLALSQIIPWNFSTTLTVDELKSCTSPISKIVDFIGNDNVLGSHTDYIFTILTELYSNALEHGILGLSSEIKKTDDGYLEYYEQRKVRLKELQEGQIQVSLSFRRQSEEGILAITMIDSGKGFAFDTKPTTNEHDSCGRGLSLIKSLCHWAEYSENGSRVDLEYRVNLSR